MDDRTLIVVNYRSAALCRDAVSSARNASSVPLEVVVVDNSCDGAEADALSGAGADQVIIASRNLGYAGGINLGLRSAAGSKIVVSNPDVVFDECSIDLLVEPLSGRVALSGPRFHWDAGGEWLMPPADLLTFGTKLTRTMAKRFSTFAARRSRSRFLERVAFWRREEPIAVPAVSGAVMAIERTALAKVGGFDERYRLYYEEIDLMRALARERFEILHVPAARCRHLYDQSAAGENEHQQKFAESEALYMKKWHGPGARLLEVLDRRRDPPHPRPALLEPAAAISIPAPAEAFVVEASPLESFETAAGHFPRAPQSRLPAEIWHGFHGSGLFVRVVEAATGIEIRRSLVTESK